MLQLHLSDQQFYYLLRCDLYKRFDGTHQAIACMVSTIWVLGKLINSLAPGRFGSHIKTIILKCIIQKSSLGTHREIALNWIPQNFSNEKWTLVQVMVWCRQATSHYLSHCWRRYIISVICRHIASLGHNKMHSKMLYTEQCRVCFGLNSSFPGQNGRHFPDDVFICFFFNEMFFI